MVKAKKDGFRLCSLISYKLVGVPKDSPKAFMKGSRVDRLFRYFSNESYAKDFIKGMVRFQPLAFFQAFPDETRGDRFEGVSLYRPPGGMQVTRLNGEQITGQIESYQASVDASKIFIYCLSRTLNTRLAIEFNANTSIEIFDVRGFCQRITSALPEGVELANRRLPNGSLAKRLLNPVKYYKEDEDCSVRSAFGDEIAVSKLARYAYQDEVRLMFALKNSLGYGAPTHLMAGSDYTPGSHPDPGPLIINTGDLSSFCRLRSIEKLIGGAQNDS